MTFFNKRILDPFSSIDSTFSENYAREDQNGLLVYDNIFMIDNLGPKLKIEIKKGFDPIEVQNIVLSVIPNAKIYHDRLKTRFFVFGSIDELTLVKIQLPENAQTVVFTNDGENDVNKQHYHILYSVLVYGDVMPKENSF